jgi:hypothetical protein
LKYWIGGFSKKNACPVARCLSHRVEASVGKVTQIFWKCQELRRANEKAEAAVSASAWTIELAKFQI